MIYILTTPATLCTIHIVGLEPPENGPFWPILTQFSTPVLKDGTLISITGGSDTSLALGMYGTKAIYIIYTHPYYDELLAWTTSRMIQW